jgi:hypothetical protein
MGLIDWLFKLNGSESKGEPTVRGRRDGITNRIDKYTHKGGEKHVHQSYTVDRKSGKYREYGSGENSGDRHYNRGSGGNKSSGGRKSK